MANPKSNAEASELLLEIKNLMELQGENPFKIRAFDKAADVLAKLPATENLTERARQGNLTDLQGIGKGISEVLTEFLLHSTSTAKDQLSASMPAGLLELTEIPGLGPKKAKLLIEELEIHSVRELEYACKENRLLNIKGFGIKVQAKILEGIQFMNSHIGQARICDVFPAAEKLFKRLLAAANAGRHPATEGFRVVETGELRRRLEILSSIEFMVEIPAGERAAKEIRSNVQNEVEKFQNENPGVLPIKVYFATTPHFGYELAKSTSTEAHWSALGNPDAFDAVTEEDFYTHLGLPCIPPEARETGEEVALARAGKLDSLLPWDGVQGIFHNHTLRSDGNATLEEMVVGAKRLGYRYIGISDHSQTAFYAQGLKVPTLLEQEREIREVQEKHPDIRIFWGIESDILADGSLDYETPMLKKFDFVIASVHSRFKMEKEAMTDRILAAIQNPYTRFLGHATGRLLLGRQGYALDMERVIEEAAKRDVAIEINANPARLDIDWRWGKKLRECGTQVSINPDAHEVAGLEDTRYGVAVARKALLSTSCVVNARSVKEVERWLKRA